jgi:hypothetical protein
MELSSPYISLACQANTPDNQAKGGHRQRLVALLFARHGENGKILARRA